MSTSLLFASARNSGTLPHRHLIVERAQVVLVVVMAVSAWEMVRPTGAIRTL